MANNNELNNEEQNGLTWDRCGAIRYRVLCNGVEVYRGYYDETLAFMKGFNLSHITQPSSEGLRFTAQMSRRNIQRY